MLFELLPVIDTMLALYGMPRTPARFEAYLKILQGDTRGDLVLPVSGFNPMAREHVPDQLQELQQLDAEEIIGQTCRELNEKLQNLPESNFRMALNLADDLHGGWTNRFTTNYDSKFKLSALINRKFCTPFFWSGEAFSRSLIRHRALEAGYRTAYRLSHPQPVTLGDHIRQERFVALQTGGKTGKFTEDFSKLETFYREHQDDTDYHLIFNFLYGDDASASLGFRCYGIRPAFAGFGFAESTRNQTE